MQAHSKLLTTEWRHLAMLNFEISPAVLEPLVPAGTELDTWQDRTLVSVVGLCFCNTRILGLAVPWHANFEEVNLRFYARRRVRAEWRRGVVFIREIVRRRAIAAVARWIYNENYIALPMRSSIHPPSPGKAGSVEYAWRKDRVWNSLRAEYQGLSSYAQPGSEEEFITEHYWGYATQRDGSSLEYSVEHPPWQVWRATSARLDCDVRGIYGVAFEESLSRIPSSAFIACGSDVCVYRGLPLAVDTCRPDQATVPSRSWRPELARDCDG